jgi:hypothetical protein
MIPDPPLTDEELAALDAIDVFTSADTPRIRRVIDALRASQGDLAYHIDKSDLATAEAARLAEDLRASREEVERLRGELAAIRSGGRSYRVDL